MNMEINGFDDTIAWYDANAEAYAKKTDDFVKEKVIAQFISLLPPVNAEVLDLGCGVGKTTRVLSENGLKVTGVDISDGLLTEAKKRAPELNFVKGDMRELRLPSCSFDGVFAQASLVHLETMEDVERTLSEIHGVLKENGIFFFSVKAKLGDSETEVVSDKLSGHPRFFRYYTKEQLTELLTKHGFEVLEMGQENETVQDPTGRPEVDWIFVFARKTT